MNWGSVPDWGAAVGTVGALWVSYRLLRRESVERLQGDARRVAAWLGVKHVGASQRVVEIRVLNSGETPVYDCYVTVGRIANTPEESARISVGTVPPNVSISKQRTEDQFVGLPETWWVNVDFKDSSGRTWLRDHNGNLTRLDHGS